MKDESRRFGLPSFKILGASWGTFRALASKFNLSLDLDFESTRQALSDKNVTLYAATDGNHGRAVGRMGRLLRLPVEIHVPATMYAATIELIRSEEAQVVVSKGSYDDAVLEAYAASKERDGILIQDFASGDYAKIPQWIVDGYGTMMHEIEDQLAGEQITHVFSPIGVGSFTQAVTTHFRRPGSTTSVIGVEPDTAACLYKSVKAGQSLPLETQPTIMAGLDCGTVSTTAWPILSKGLRASMTISVYEAHESLPFLKTQGVSAGPCGASTTAALRRLTAEDRQQLGLGPEKGSRDYDTPLDITIDDPVELTQMLVQINSASPTLGSVTGPGETAIARYIHAWLEHRGIETHWTETTRGRPSIVGVVRGTGGGRSLMFNGHIDTVTLMGYDGNPLSGPIKDGKLYGRGAADMNCGVAAAMVALADCKALGLRGDVIFTGVADEEDQSMGTEDVLKAGWRADAAVVDKPTNLSIVNTHKGFVWLEVDIHGLAYHGSRADIGVDAIAKAGHFLAELDNHAQDLRKSLTDSAVGPPTIHASLIKGGEEVSSYPALCTITIEKRTLAGETAESVAVEIKDMLEKIKQRVPDFNYDLRTTFSRPAFENPRDSSFCKLVGDMVGKATGKEADFRGEPYWGDCALLAEKGISSVLWGPTGGGLHAKTEWVDIESIRTVRSGLARIAKEFCK
ncbi:Pyridoxal-phosphate dependent enzyme-like protein 6 [Elsinoe fawcettii]|nr:Pyridoxal-phosphate dependent enzyme-like protein 6 [Elsinoe fawcettii]